MYLSELQTGETGFIVKVKGRGAFRKRIMEMGFVKGKAISVIKNAPLNDPIEYQIMGYDVSLRRNEANLIEVVKNDSESVTENNYNGTIEEHEIKSIVTEKVKNIHIALVGNPNCGKTTLFNYASNSKEHVGNYSGVTVDAKSANFKYKGYSFNVTDLPGTYSLTAYSPEELYVRNYIHNNVPDIVINVIDASNLERNLYLTSQLIDMDIKVVAALNMYDELQKKGDKFDYVSLGKMLGIPFIPTISSKGKGLAELFDKVIEAYEDSDPILRHIHINYGTCTEKSIKKIQEHIKIKQNLHLTDKISSRFLSLKLLERDNEAIKIVSNLKNATEIINQSEKEISRIEETLNDDSETIITDAKYGFIAGALKETYKESGISRRKRTDIIDTLITHKVFGFPIFILFMWVMFQTTFSLGAYPMDWIDHLVSFISNLVEKYMADGTLKDLIIDGIIGGVGGVIIFLPNILILFFFISLMEDTGYMSRAAFIMDKIMHKFGLHGKSFIPLVMGFGCNVPAIMATRTIEGKNDRLLTILINPLMSCSARLPVYVLLIGAFFPTYPGLVLFSVYLVGILLSVIIAIIFKKTIFKSKESPFVMELPPYRLPTLKSTLKHMWNKAGQYLKKMGGIILVASIIIWYLGYFPQNIEYSKNYEQAILTIEKEFDSQINQTTDTLIISTLMEQRNQQITTLKIEKEAEQRKNTYIGRMGQFIEPVIKPLGMDWKMGVSMIAGVAAKEIIVSTMGVLYQNHNTIVTVEDSEDYKKLSNRLRTYVDENGNTPLNPVNAYAFMLFILIYFPCMASIAAIKKETGSWKWALFTVAYTTILAWVISFSFYQIASLFI